MSSVVHRTFCRNCQAACGLIVETEENHIVSVRGDRAHAITQGFMCIKGTMSGDLHNGAGRLTSAQKGDRRGGSSSIDIERALDEIAAKVGAIIEQHGPNAVALYFGTGAKFNTLGTKALQSWLLQCVGSPYLYSSSTIDQSAKWITMLRMGVFVPGKPVIQDTDLMLAVGSNPYVSHWGAPIAPFPGSRMQTWVREAKARGAKLIVIDPRRTEFARHADIHLQALPGEDVSLLAGMIHVILERGLEDAEFCGRFVTSLDALRTAVRDFTPAYAAGRAGVDQGQLIEAAELFATTRRRTAWSGTGPNMSPHSNLSEHLVETLNAICGAYRRAGDTIVNVTRFPPGGKCVEGVRPPNRTWEQEPKLHTQDSGIVGSEFPTSRLPDEILHGGVRALIAVGNLAGALGQPAKTRAALDALDLLVTIDPRMTETGRLSDYVLPTKLPYERYDLTPTPYFLENFAQLAQPVTEAPPGVLEDWEIFWGLARRMNKPLSLMAHRWGSTKASAPDIPIDMETKPTSEQLMWAVCEGARIPADALFAQPEGVSADLEPITVSAPDHDDGARLDVCPSDVAAELAAVRREAPPTNDFPFRLTVRRMIETMNSAFRDGGVTQARWPQTPAFINPADMETLGLAEGEAVEVVSDTGAVTGSAQPDPSMRPGVISMPHIWGGDGGHTNALVSLDDNLDDINFMPRQSAIPIRLQRPAKAV